MGQACCSTSKSNAIYIAKKASETRIKCIPFDAIRVKSLYDSALDLCAVGLLKRALGKKHPRTLNGLRKTVEEEWSKMGKKVLRKSLLRLKDRARIIVKNQGYLIEANCHKKNTSIGQ
ncbi:hypothetical protein TNCV_287491 [Trichonephila clavipes]|nr:hypothetical protein TNCV_287491 [Trichonephila clavipes]